MSRQLGCVRAIILLILLMVAVRCIPEAGASHSPPLDATCRYGWVLLHKQFDDEGVFKHFPKRKDPRVDGYIALDAYDRDIMGSYWWFRWRQEDSWHLVRVADVRQWRHQEEHDRLWGDTWLAEISESMWKDRPIKPWRGVMCRAYLTD